MTHAVVKAPVRRHRLRSDIYQASWNYKYKDQFPLLIFVLAVTLGIISQSWLIGLIAFIAFSLMPHHSATQGLISLLWGAIGAGIGAVILGVFGIGAALTGAFVGFAIAWVPMRASEQYWRDLEQDGGPYSD